LVGASCAVRKDYGDESDVLSVLLEYFKSREVNFRRKIEENALMPTDYAGHCLRTLPKALEIENLLEYMLYITMSQF
jgi:hypothetical protein